jgi:hypothetical protein
LIRGKREVFPHICHVSQSETVQCYHVTKWYEDLWFASYCVM